MAYETRQCIEALGGAQLGTRGSRLFHQHDQRLRHKEIGVTGSSRAINASPIYYIADSYALCKHEVTVSGQLLAPPESCGVEELIRHGVSQMGSGLNGRLPFWKI